MEKKKYVITVAGHTFNIISDESEKHILSIAEKVDLKIQSLSRENSKIGREAGAILAALDFCDDEAKSQQAINQLKDQIKDYLQDSKDLQKQLKDANAKIKKLESEINKLNKKINKNSAEIQRGQYSLFEDIKK